MSHAFAPVLVLALTLFSSASRAAHGGEISVVEVPPGSVVRWMAPGTEACLMEGRRWAPLGEECWFAIDLLRSEDLIEVGRMRSGVEERARIVLSEYPYPVQHITLEDDTRVDLSPENRRRVAAEQERIAVLWGSGGEPRFELPLSSPLAQRGSAGRFGSRRFFNEQPRSPHTGADYSAASGDPVLAVAAGRVVMAEDLFFSGNSVFIDHGDGLVSMYFHLSEIQVEVGDDVEPGVEIGRVGQTGRATGPHLHFGVRWRGARIDPELLLASTDLVPTIP